MGEKTEEGMEEENILKGREGKGNGKKREKKRIKTILLFYVHTHCVRYHLLSELFIQEGLRC